MVKPSRVAPVASITTALPETPLASITQEASQFNDIDLVTIRDSR